MRSPFRLFLLATLSFLAVAPSASADDWLPHPANARWTYRWSDSVYSKAPTTERVTVKSQSSKSFTLAWTTAGLGNPKGAAPNTGTVTFRDAASGLENTSWSSTPPPASFPVLCADATGCGQSLASTWYLVIWGSRAPVLPQEFTPGTEWSSAGGTDGGVTSVSTYDGVNLVKVPAFRQAVPAVEIRSEITQVGALGDPYGSGIRTVWWVYGVGPVKVVFEHTGGVRAPTTTSTLQRTNLRPLAPPQFDAYFPLRQGLTLTYSFRNTKHLTTPSIQRFTLEQVKNASATYTVTTLSGPISVSGQYGFSVGSAGVVNIWAITRASLGKISFPPLGPAALPPARRRHFATPFDLMMFGFNPILPAKPDAGTTWQAAASGRDFSIFGVRGRSRVIGTTTVRTPAGVFRQAVGVETTLEQRGFPFGSGTRTSWFARGVGLVKLVFHHDDGSTSTVQLLHARNTPVPVEAR